MPIPRSKSFRRLVAKTSTVVEYKYNIPITCNEMSTGVVVYMVCEPISGPGIGIGRMGSKFFILFIFYRDFRIFLYRVSSSFGQFVDLGVLRVEYGVENYYGHSIRNTN